MNTFSTCYSLHPAALLAIIGILGAIIGSFLSVCIFRIPHGRPKGPPSFEEMNGIEVEGEQDIVEAPVTEKLTIGDPPRSFCPNCKNKLLWWHNIPILSWLLLSGKCYFCKQRISFRYPLVECLSAAIAVASVHSFGFTPTAGLVYAFCAALIVISFIDIEYYIIPDVISLPGAAIGLVVGLVNHFFHIFEWPVAVDFWGSLIGLAFGGGILLAISEFYIRVRKRVGLGLGDVKLLAMTGAFFGFQGAFCTIFFGSLIGSVFGILMILFFRKGMTHHLPFGPYLALGTIIYIFSGPNLLFQF